MTTLRQRMIEDMRVRNLSPKTQEIYVGLVARFARHFRKSPELLGPEEVRAFQVHLVEKQLSLSLCGFRADSIARSGVFRSLIPGGFDH